MTGDRQVTTLVEFCLRRAETHGSAVAVTDDHATLTYQALADKAARAARALIAESVRPGDRVVLSAPNSVTWVVAAFGVVRCGGVVVPVNHQAPVEQRRRTINVIAPILTAIRTGRGSARGCSMWPSWTAVGRPLRRAHCPRSPRTRPR